MLQTNVWYDQNVFAQINPIQTALVLQIKLQMSCMPRTKRFRARYIYIVDCYDLVEEAGSYSCVPHPGGTRSRFSLRFAFCNLLFNFLLFTHVQCCWLFASLKFLLGGCGCLVFGVFTWSLNQIMFLTSAQCTALEFVYFAFAVRFFGFGEIIFCHYD